MAFWNYSKTNKKKFDNLLINYNQQSNYFQGKLISENRPKIFDALKNDNTIHALIFLLKKKEDKIDNEIKNFLQKKKSK